MNPVPLVNWRISILKLDLHIGSLRTYIYNYLFAKKHYGTLILRIDDTDKSRNVPGSLEDIISVLRWIGLDWDEGVYKSKEDHFYYQSNRNDIYKVFAEKLVDNNDAYYCFCKESLVSKLLQKWFNIKFEKTEDKCLYLTEKEVENKLNKGNEYAIKLKSYNDEFDDFVLIRSNGCATYNFSSCVDDYLMKITHIIRGSDHTFNTNKQKLIFKLMKVKHPEFISVPLIVDENQLKLSKRTNKSLTVQHIILDGICPLPLINYLTLLGTEYSHHKNIYEIDELMDKFTFNITNSSFNYDKLLHLNKMYLHNISNKVFLKELNKYYEYNEKHINGGTDNGKEKTTMNSKTNTEKNMSEWLKKAWIREEFVDIYKTRVNTLKEYFLNVKSSLDYDYENIRSNIGEYEEDLKKWIKEELMLLMEKRKNIIDLHIKFIQLLKEMGESENKVKILQLMRFLLTGETVGPSLMDMVTLEIIVALKHRTLNEQIRKGR
ncbi:glutamate--tRNA ligase [Theileria orientalis]|uniref:Glutamate--tRNA ligase n=1 Tax=Theileria orientalis TaxID=68886 RepID=A0A976M9Y5_THEOR|nr:glutamate--tRNA ligase [Theileria orientalis]